MAILSKTTAPSAHWYTKDGASAHVQRKADGDGERATTVTDARRLHLLPSVSSILGIIGKGGLETWKVKQGILSALRNPKQDTETEDFWVQRVYNAAFEQVEDAANLGSRIHDALDQAIDGTPYDEELAPYISPVLAWVDTTGIQFTARELCVVNAAEGYAGRADVFFSYGKSGIGILDYKTRRTKPGEKVTPYEGQGLQLAAYAAAHYGVDALPRVLAANVYISTTEPGRMEVCKHDALPELYGAFLHACGLWRHLKNYDPRGA